MQCSNCGQELVAGGAFCGNCGAKISNSINAQPTGNLAQQDVPVTPLSNTPQAPTAEQPPLPQQPPISQNPSGQLAPLTPVSNAGSQTLPNTATAIPKEQSGGSGLSIASMVLGIFSILNFIFWFTAIPLSILAIIFGVIGMNKSGRGMALAGIITGVIGIIVTVGTIILMVSLRAGAIN